MKANEQHTLRFTHSRDALWIAKLKKRKEGYRNKISQTGGWRHCLHPILNFHSVCKGRIRPKASMAASIPACSSTNHVHASNLKSLPHILFHYPVYALLAKRAPTLALVGLTEWRKQQQTCMLQPCCLVVFTAPPLHSNIRRHLSGQKHWQCAPWGVLKLSGKSS